MSRLPKPGSDQGKWGEILNEYLSQAHKQDGTLKEIPISKVANLQAQLDSKQPSGEYATEESLSGKLDSVNLSQAVAHEINSASSNPVKQALSAAYARMPVVNVLDYGAVGDNLTNNDAAFAAAFAAAISAKLPIYFPPGDYRITSEMDWRGDGVRVSGLRATIWQMTDNVGIMHLGGRSISLDGLHLRYNAEQPDANTNAYCLSLSDVSFGRFSNLRLYKGYRGITQPSVGVNTLYSSRFENIHSSTMSGWHILLSPTSGGNTGSIFQNIYMMNNPDGTKRAGTGGIALLTASEVTLRQINVEHGKYGTGIFLQGVDGATIDGVHFEGYESNSDAGGFFNLTSSNASIRNVTLYNNTFDGSVAPSYSVVRMNGVSKLDLQGLKESSSSLLNTPTIYRLFAVGAGSTARFRDITKSLTLADYIYPGIETTAPVIQMDNRRIPQAILARSSTLATAATVGFAYLPQIAGTPTGTPITEAGGSPVAVDIANSKLWVYVGGTWKSTSLT